MGPTAVAPAPNGCVDAQIHVHMCNRSTEDFGRATQPIIDTTLRDQQIACPPVAPRAQPGARIKDKQQTKVPSVSRSPLRCLARWLCTAYDSRLALRLHPLQEFKSNRSVSLLPPPRPCRMSNTPRTGSELLAATKTVLARAQAVRTAEAVQRCLV